MLLEVSDKLKERSEKLPTLDTKISISLISIQDNITLEKLNLQGNWIEGDGAAAMARMLEENDYITELVSRFVFI